MKEIWSNVNQDSFEFDHDYKQIKIELEIEPDPYEDDNNELKLHMSMEGHDFLSLILKMVKSYNERSNDMYEFYDDDNGLIELNMENIHDSSEEEY